MEGDKIAWYSNNWLILSILKRLYPTFSVLKAWKKVKLHGAQTPDVAGTIFEGKWNCMMLKLAFEPELALEVEEITGHSNAETWIAFD